MKYIISESHLSRLLSEEMVFLFASANVKFETNHEWVVELKFDYMDEESEKILSYDFDVHLSKDSFIRKNYALGNCIWKLEMHEPTRDTFDYDDPEKLRTRLNWLFKQGNVKTQLLKALQTNIREKINENKILKEDKRFLFATTEITFNAIKSCIINVKFSFIDDITEEIETYDFDVTVKAGDRLSSNRVERFIMNAPESIQFDRNTPEFVEMYNWMFEQGNVHQTFMETVREWRGDKINENKNYGNYTKKDILTIVEDESEIKKGKKGFWDYRLVLEDLSDTYFEFNLKLGEDIENGDYIEYNIGGEITNQESPFGEDWWIEVISQLHPEYKEIKSDDVMWDYIFEMFEDEMENILNTAFEEGKIIQKGGNAFRR